MNCLDYRRALLPGNGETEAMRAHRLECVFCADLHKESLAFYAQLLGALQVPVPEGLGERLLAAIPAGAGEVAKPRIDRRRFLAAAAVGAGAIGIGTYALMVRDDPVALACIGFVMKEETKSIMMGAMPREEAAAALADSLPVERIEKIGKVMHIGPCPFQGGTAYHVVLMVPQDKVTLLVMPDDRSPASGRAAQEGMYARVVKLRKGSVGIVGMSREVVNSVAGALRA